jgi:hypothetical protein
MPTSSQRETRLQFTGDVVAGFILAAAVNASASAQEEIKQLVLGANTITVPTGGSTVFPNSVTIVPPAGNTTALTLKGVTGDTGILLHPTDPTTIAFTTTVANFVLTAATTINGVRLYWT